MNIHLISGPRNISTALMYSFANRADCEVIDEPFYGYYLMKRNIDHPGKEETIASMELDFDKIVATQFKTSPTKKYRFLKNMAHHMIDMKWDFILNSKNVFLIRDPKQLIASFTKVISHPTMDDIGLKLEYEIANFLAQKGIISPIIIDSNDLLLYPEYYLKKLCQKLEIPFSDKMLKWETGPIPEDGVWAKYWYKSVHKSTHFKPQISNSRKLPKHCEILYEEAKHYFDLLSEHKL